MNLFARLLIAALFMRGDDFSKYLQANMRPPAPS
jgi:hypothetical protein